MKVVHSKIPTEDVTLENVFGERYTPTNEEEFKIILEWCPVEEVEDLKEDIIWLSEDILDHEDALEMLWEKIQSVEDDQQQDVENLSNVVDILGCLQKANKLMLDVIIEQNEQIKKLDGEIKEVDNGWIVLFWFLVVWNFILTCVLCYHVF